jgi:hypothetical protein
LVRFSASFSTESRLIPGRRYLGAIHIGTIAALSRGRVV